MPGRERSASGSQHPTTRPPLPSRTHRPSRPLPHALLWLLALCAVLAAACQPFTPAPTLAAPVELVSPTPPPARRPRPTPRSIPSPVPSAAGPIAGTATPTLNPLLATNAQTDAPPRGTIDPRLLTQVAVPVQTATLAPGAVLIGRTVEGRGILARRLGSGSRTILLVGGIHGGYEVNTVALMNEVIAHFSATPEDIAPGLSLVVVPALNPDGLLRGREAAGRFNANGVDLNRNWACDWSPEAFWQDRAVDPGPQPFSEPETAALADYILQNPPVAALFYHSAANGVFAGACDGDHGSQALGHLYGQAAGYPSDSPFSHYEVTGDASSWVDGQGIPAITVELQSWTETEWARNFAGIMAVQCQVTRRLGDPLARQWVGARCAPGEP